TRAEKRFIGTHLLFDVTAVQRYGSSGRIGRHTGRRGSLCGIVTAGLNRWVGHNVRNVSLWNGGCVRILQRRGATGVDRYEYKAARALGDGGMRGTSHGD